MAECILIKGGGGADLDVVTAGAEHVLSGKVIVDKDGNPLTGTMPNNTSLTSNGTVPGISSSFPAVPTREGLNLQMTTATDGVVRISMCPPSGYYPGAVNDGSYVNRPASDFGNAPASAIDPDYTATSQHGLNIRGTMPTMAGGTKTPTTSQQTISCSGKKMTSNIVIPAFSLPSASDIVNGKKVTIYGKSVTGTTKALKTKNGSGTLSSSTTYSNGMAKSVYTMSFNPGFTPVLVAWTDGGLVGYWGGGWPAHIRGTFESDAPSADSGIKFTSSQIILPGRVKSGTVWYSVAGY